MTDSEINQAVEAFRRLLQQNRDCQFGRLEGLIHKGHLKDLTLLPEVTGIRNGQVVVMEIPRD